MKPIHVIILLAIILFLFFSMRKKTVNVEHMRSMVNPIPDYNAYQPMESPSDTRYVYYPEENVYLLPYEELDMTFPYHRWMYYYYPSFYSSYYSYNWPFNYPANNSQFFYGGNYGGDYGGDFAGYYGDYSIKTDPLYRTFPYRTESPNRVIIPLLFQSPKFSSNNYPTSETGFAGGLYSQRFSNAGSSLRRGSIQGRTSPGIPAFRQEFGAPSFGETKTLGRERFDVIAELDADEGKNDADNELNQQEIVAVKKNHCNSFDKNTYRKIDTGSNLLIADIASRGGNTSFPYERKSCHSGIDIATQRLLRPSRSSDKKIEQFITFGNEDTQSDLPWLRNFQNDLLDEDNMGLSPMPVQHNNIIIDTTPQIINYAEVQSMSNKNVTSSYPGYSLFAMSQLDYPDDEFGYVINDDTVASIDNKSASSSNETEMMNREIARSGLEEPIAMVL